MELQNVTFSYEDDDRKILQALNFQVYPGEQVTLSGRTGAGKSTVFKLLLGLYQPGEGKVLIQGRDAFQIPENEKRSLYGYVEQTFHRVPGTVKIRSRCMMILLPWKRYGGLQELLDWMRR